MRARALFSLVGALVAAVALVSVSGAGTSKAQKVARIDVSTRAAVVHYLRSIHVNARGAVIERGARNYAGAHCPGTRWTCASTRHTVVQIAKRGGQNRFVCRSSRCAVVQIAGASHGVYIAGRRLASTAAPSKSNKAVCIRTTGLGASCSITQKNATADNQAFVYEDAGKVAGLTQSALYTAAITQTAMGASSSNTACVHQFINIDGSTTASGKKGSPVTVTLEAHQSVTIKQDVAGSGSNNAINGATSSSLGACDVSPLTQSQTLMSKATGSGSITQNEDAAFSACGDGVPGDYANMCLDIEQNQGTGRGVASGANNATFTQTSTQSAIANTPAGPVSQTQSSICANNPNAPADCLVPGGLVGTVNQDSTGVSTASATQNETQCEDAATSSLIMCHTAPGDNDFDGSYQLTQNQFGPVGVGKLRNRHRGRQLYAHLKGLGTSTQTGGNTGDLFTISQTSTQDDDQGSGSTQKNFGQADCSTSGNCTVDQSTTVDGSKTTNTQTGQNVSAQTTCSGSVCTPSGGSGGTDFNVLIAGAGDFGNTGANDNLAAALTSAGYTVTESATLPADLSSFGQVWWVDTDPPTAAEQSQLVAFEQSGRGVFLTGENDGCCGGGETASGLNPADQSMVNSIVSGGGITIGGQDVCCTGTPVDYPVNSSVVGNLATQPNTVTSWTATYPGAISGMLASSVFAYYQPNEFTTQVVAAAWDRPSTVGNGRLAVFMDINWAQTAWQGANWSDVADNVTFFLSGLSSPPNPILLAAPFAASAPLGTLATHPGVASRTAG
jgi:hypothetical protein